MLLAGCSIPSRSRFPPEAAARPWWLFKFCSCSNVSLQVGAGICLVCLQMEVLSLDGNTKRAIALSNIASCKRQLLLSQAFLVIHRSIERGCYAAWTCYSLEGLSHHLQSAHSVVAAHSVTGHILKEGMYTSYCAAAHNILFSLCPCECKAPNGVTSRGKDTRCCTDSSIEKQSPY